MSIGHAIRRARERYGLKLTKADIHEAARQIRNRKARFVRNSSHVASLWIVKLQGKDLVAVYYCDIDEVVSFLPEDAAK